MLQGAITGDRFESRAFSPSPQHTSPFFWNRVLRACLERHENIHDPCLFGPVHTLDLVISPYFPHHIYDLQSSVSRAPPHPSCEPSRSTFPSPSSTIQTAFSPSSVFHDPQVISSRLLLFDTYSNPESSRGSWKTSKPRRLHAITIRKATVPSSRGQALSCRAQPSSQSHRRSTYLAPAVFPQACVAYPTGHQSPNRPVSWASILHNAQDRNTDSLKRHLFEYPLSTTRVNRATHWKSQ